MLWLLESGLVAIARLLLYLRLLGQVTNLFPQLTRRLSAGEPHARVRGPCAQFGGMGLEHVQQPLPVALVVPDALVVARPVEARKAEDAGHWTSVAGYGEVFTTTELFDVTAARDHFDGTVEAGECRFCAFDARNREHHAQNAGKLF